MLTFAPSASSVLLGMARQRGPLARRTSDRTAHLVCGAELPQLLVHGSHPGRKERIVQHPPDPRPPVQEPPPPQPIPPQPEPDDDDDDEDEDAGEGTRNRSSWVEFWDKKEAVWGNGMTASSGDGLRRQTVGVMLMKRACAGLFLGRGAAVRSGEEEKWGKGG